MREIIYLASTADTGTVVTTTKNKRAQKDKLKLKKYDPKIRKHVMFEEVKSVKPISKNK